jgi:DNA-binding NtrC family response regulator/CHASE2 domain-containing sensor protein
MEKPPGRAGSLSPGMGLALFLIAICSILIPYFLAFIFPSFFNSFESKLHDGLFRLRYSLEGKEVVSPYIIHIVFDDESLSLINPENSERDIYTKLIRTIAESDAKVIGCDVLFEYTTTDGNDLPLIEAVKKAGNVYFPIVLSRGKNRGDSLSPTQGDVSSDVGSKVLWQQQERGGVRLPKAGDIIAPFGSLFRVAAGAGHINCEPDADGINRRFPLVIGYNSSIIPALPLRMICGYLSVRPEDVEMVFGSRITLRNAVFPGRQIKDIIIPVDEAGSVTIDYVAPWQNSFYTISVKDFISASEGDSRLRLNLHDVLENSIVLISDTSARNKDVGPGIFDNLIPYSEILVTLMNMILTDNFIHPLPPFIALVLFSVFILLLWFASSLSRLVLRIIGACSAMIACVAFSICLFLFVHILAPLFLPIAGFVLYLIAENIYWAYLSNLAVLSFRKELEQMKVENMRAKDAWAVESEKSAEDVGRDQKGANAGNASLGTEHDGNEEKILQKGKLKYPEAFERIVTANSTMINIFLEIEAYKNSDAPILIIGETGVGKELIAHAIHHVSGRKGKYVTVNVAGIDDELFNDTLFGHKRGAYTGAEKDEAGFVEVAEGGTLFLDEIGDLSNASQIKLLRLIENKEYYPLNSKIPLKADVRIIAATNADLNEKVRNKSLRDDLARRLGLRLNLPPLRQRTNDIRLLLDHFIDRSSTRAGKNVPRYSPDLPKLLESYHFPGNIRELESMVEEAISKNESEILSLSVFRERIVKENQAGEAVVINPNESRRTFAFTGSLILLLEEIESAYIKDALNKTKGNRRKAAKLLGVNYDWLKRRVKEQDSE